MNQPVDLDLLGLTPRTRGRAAIPSQAVTGRELTPADIALLETDRKVEARPVAKLRDTHHRLARALASGMKPGEAAIVAQYSLSRVSVLQADPSFRELVEFYRANVNLAYSDVYAGIASLSMDAVTELRDRLEADPESMSNTFLLDLLKVTADRSGHGPKSTNVNLNVDLSARLQAARMRVAEAPLIEAQAAEVPPDEEPAP